MNVSPATSVCHSLVGDMVVHGHEFLTHFLLHPGILRIMIRQGNGFHQVEIRLHLHAQFGKHVLVPVRNHPLVSLRLTHHEDRQSAHLSILIYNMISVVFPTDIVNLLLGKFARRVNHVPVTLLHQVHVLKFLRRHRH